MSSLSLSETIGMSKRRLGRSEVCAIPAPEFTETWHPVPHKDVIESLDVVTKETGLKVRNESYSVMNGGSNLFGTWTLDREIGNGYLAQIGFRNSTSKQFAVGICSGTHVIACSNLMFKGEFIEFRKHTSGIGMEVLLEKAKAAFSFVMKKAEEVRDWQEALRGYELPEPEFKQVTFDAMLLGVIAPNRFKAFLEFHGEEVDLSGNHSLFEFHGAVTRMNRDNNLFTVSNRTNVMIDLCNRITGEKLN